MDQQRKKTNHGMNLAVKSKQIVEQIRNSSTKQFARKGKQQIIKYVKSKNNQTKTKDTHIMERWKNTFKSF